MFSEMRRTVPTSSSRTNDCVSIADRKTLCTMREITTELIDLPTACAFCTICTRLGGMSWIECVARMQ